MVEKASTKREKYQYPIVSLFGPRSLKHDLLLKDYFNKAQLKFTQNLAPYEQINSANDETTSSTRIRIERQADLTGTASGYGDYYCPEGIPIETALLCLLGAFGLAFGALFRAITLKTGGRRRKRSTGEFTTESTESSLSIIFMASDLLWSGR